MPRRIECQVQSDILSPTPRIIPEIWLGVFSLRAVHLLPLVVLPLSIQFQPEKPGQRQAELVADVEGTMPLWLVATEQYMLWTRKHKERRRIRSLERQSGVFQARMAIHRQWLGIETDGEVLSQVVEHLRIGDGDRGRRLALDGDGGDVCEGRADQAFNFRIAQLIRR